MKRFLSTCILALVALLSLSCTENTGSVSDIRLGSGIPIVPRFVYLGSQSSVAAISQIRLTARNSVTNAVVATKTLPVANDAVWTLDFDVPSDAGTITVLIELLSGSPGTETIEWSGVTAEIHITPGTAVAPQTVTLYQGPPGNLDVVSVNVTPATASVVEGTPVVLTGQIIGGGAGAKIIWSTLDPTVATVDQNGNVATLRNGTARVTGVAGPRVDTTFITVTQRPNSITLSPDTGRINTMGADAVFTARVLDPRGAEITGAGINWTAANSAVVDNLGNGRFRARANGSTQVSATSATAATVTRSGTVVVAQRAARVQIIPPTATLNAIGFTHQFSAAVQDANGNTMTAPVTWRSGNAAIATIDATTGLATARSNGTADIIAVINAGAPDSVVARGSLVVLQTLSGIAVTPANANFASLGETGNFSAEARDANANVIAGVTFVWSSTNAAVVTIDQNGTARAIGNGNAQVSASAGGISGSANVAVRQVATTVTVAPVLDSVAIGATKTFTATARDARNNLIAGATFAWRSSDAAKATVNGTGVAQGVATGSVTIQATLDAASGNASLVVVQRARRIQITPAAATLNALGATQQFTAAIQDGNGTAMTVPVVWRSGSPAVATIDANGLATARAGGTTDIIAVVNAGAPDSVVAHASLTVNQNVGTVIVTPGNANFASLGETARLAAEARDGNNNVIAGVVFGWTSANPGIATVDPNGTVHAVANGTTQITASGGGVNGAATITVRQLATVIFVTPAADTIPVNGTRGFNASARDARANPIADASFTWSSSNPDIATVDDAGIALGVAGGTTTITAFADGASGAATLVVRNPLLPNLRAFTPVVTPFDTVNEGGDVIVVIKVKNTGPVASTPTNLRLGIALADAPTVLRDTSVALPAIAAGDSIMALLTIHLTNIGAFPDSLRVSLLADAAGTVAESDEGDNTKFSRVVFVKFLDRQWLGITNNWNDPANWLPAGVPHRTSIATIPSGTPQTPVLTSNVEIAGLIQQTENQIDIEEFNLTVNGSITGASLHGGGTVFLTRTGTIDGTLANVIVRGPVTLDATVVANNVSVEQGGQLIMGGNHFLALGNFATTGNGILVMTNAADDLVINGCADFSGGSTVNKLTLGRITVKGATFHAGGIARSYSPAAAHETFFSGSAPQALSLDEPGTANTAQHFGTLYIENNSGVTVNSDIAVLGNVEFGTSGGNLIGVGRTATLLGGIEDHISEGAFYQIDNTIFAGTEVELTPNLHTNATFKRPQTLENDETYHIYGSLTIDGGLLILNGSHVYLDGQPSYNFSTVNGGKLTMTNTDDRLHVGGDVTFNGGSEVNRLTEGTIYVGKDFAAMGGPTSFVAGPHHVTKMYGYDFEYRPETHISMSQPGLSGQRFGTLRVRNPVVMTTDIVVTGNMELDGGYEILGTDLTATIQGRIYDQYYESESPSPRVITKPVRGAIIALSDDPTPVTDGKPVGPVLDARTPAAKAARAAARGLHHNRHVDTRPNSAAQLSWDGGYYHITNTILAGTLQSLPPYIETNIDVVSAVTLTSNQVEIDGNLTVSGNAANLKLLGYVPELEQYLGPYVEVEGDFQTRSGGVLTMNDNCECNTELRVYGNAAFNGGNTTGKLIGGNLDVGGNFTAGGEGGGPNAFVATGGFVTRIDNPGEAYGYATIAMGNANNTTGNRFQYLIIDRPTQLETDIATRDIDISSGNSLTGVDLTAYVSGNIYTSCSCDSPARGPRMMGKAPTASLKPAPAHSRVGSAANSAAMMWEDPYMVANTVLNGTGTQGLPSYLTTNLTVVSNIGITNTDYYYSNNEINGNVTVTGSGAAMRVFDQFTVDGDFATADGGILVLSNNGCDCSPSMVFNGNATFDGGSELDQLEAGDITMTGQNGHTLTAGANAHAFTTTGTQVNLSGNSDFELAFAHPLTQTIRNLYLQVLGNISIPNGLVVTGSLSENESGYFVPTFTSPTNQQLVIEGGLWLNGATFNNVTLNIDGGHPSAMTNLSFGDYDAGADRIRFTSVPVDYNSVSIDSPVFSDTGTGDFIRVLATNLDVYVYNPMPADTVTRRHATGAGSHIYWGSGEFPSTAILPVAKPAPRIGIPKQ